jgi:RNA polymerase subunit RPABC4/transcription elongation factor Spt4
MGGSMSDKDQPCVRCRIVHTNWHMCPKCYYDIIENGTEKQVTMWQGVLMWKEGELK